MLVKKQLCPVYWFDEIHSDMKEKVNSLRDSELLILRRFGHAKMCSGLRRGSIKQQIQCHKTCCFASANNYYPMKARPVKCRKKWTTDPDVTWTRSLLTWGQTRWHSAAESMHKCLFPISFWIEKTVKSWQNQLKEEWKISDVHLIWKFTFLIAVHNIPQR